MVPQTSTELDDNAETLVRTKACRLIGRFGFIESDRADLEQDLRLHLVRSRRRFDGSKARWATYATAAVDMRIKEMVRTRVAGIRDYRRVQPAAPAGEDDQSITGVTPIHRIEDCGAIECIRQADLRMDIASVLGSLSEDQRALCALLSKSSAAEAARCLNIPRWRLYERMADVRQRFAAAGLQVYCCPLESEFSKKSRQMVPRLQRKPEAADASSTTETSP